MVINKPKNNKKLTKNHIVDLTWPSPTEKVAGSVTKFDLAEYIFFLVLSSEANNKNTCALHNFREFRMATRNRFLSLEIHSTQFELEKRNYNPKSTAASGTLQMDYPRPFARTAAQQNERYPSQLEKESD